jgi:hypothetical protein
MSWMYCGILERYSLSLSYSFLTLFLLFLGGFPPDSISIQRDPVRQFRVVAFSGTVGVIIISGYRLYNYMFGFIRINQSLGVPVSEV